nr:MAG TPA: hypothetical protein [Caudoviricetes sp.]
MQLLWIDHFNTFFVYISIMYCCFIYACNI